MRRHITELPIASSKDKVSSSRRDGDLEDLIATQNEQIAKFRKLVTHQIEFENENND